MTKDYVIVTCISSHRMRYVMHKEDLQNMNLAHQATEKDLIEWAQDTVTMEECGEFSQHWLGEQIIDIATSTEEETLNLFDCDNDYLKGWDRNYKIEWIRSQVKHRDDNVHD